MKFVQLSVASFVLFLAGCSSMSNGVIAIEARAIVLDDYKASDPVSGTDFDSDIDAKGVGAQAAFNTPIVDFLLGYEKREFSGEDADEIALGVRKRFFDLAMLQPYVELRALFGELDTDGDTESYAGLALGGGVLLTIGEHFFVDGNLSYEVTDDIDVGTEETALEGVLARIGVGFSF